MVDTVEKHSPLHELALPHVGGDAVTLSHRLAESLVQVQAWPDALKQVEKQLQGLKDVQLMPAGPGRWLIEADKPGLEDKLRKSLPADQAAVTGLTHARVVVSIRGEKAEWILASGIAIDFSEGAFAVGSTQLSHHHEIGLTIHRTGADSFDLYVFTNLVRSFWHWIEKASGEVGYSVE